MDLFDSEPTPEIKVPDSYRKQEAAPKLDQCRSCRAPIRWVKMANSGKANPLDAAPSEKGNVRIGDNEIGTVVPKEEWGKGELLYLSHFATCPNQKSWRKK